MAGRALQPPGFPLFDYNVYATCGDGCLMEGVGAEAASLAGHLELDNLCWIYDNNHITIEGNTRIAFTEDVAARFLGYQWNVLLRGRRQRPRAHRARARRVPAHASGRPTLIILDTHIGYGSPHRQDTAAAHGEPLGVEEVKLTKRAYGWPEDAQFLVPDGVREHFAQGVGARGARGARRLERAVRALPRRRIPALAAEDRPDAEARAARRLGPRPARVRRRMPRGWRAAMPRPRC